MSDKKPSDFLKLLLTSDIVEQIVKQTNLYADQYFTQESPPPRSKVQEWKKKIFTANEFFQFVALIIVMGIIHYPRIDDYWITRWTFTTNTFSKVMTRDRFSCLLKFFHLNDNSKMPKKSEPGYDPLYKIRPMLNCLVENFKSNYNLGKEISIDESMVSFKGRLWFIQYIPKKPTKWGMKAFVLADAISGYTYNWILYTGNDHDKIAHTCINNELTTIITNYLQFSRQKYVTYRD